MAGAALPDTTRTAPPDMKPAIAIHGKGSSSTPRRPRPAAAPCPDVVARLPRRPARLLHAGGAALAAGLLAGCAGPLSTLDPAGPEAGSIARLWWVMLAGATVLFALVLGLFALVMLRPGFGRGMSPGRWIIAGGIAMPLPVLLALLLYALLAGEGMVRPVAGEQAFRVEAVGRQWEWEFSYPDLPDVPPTVNILHIPAGERVEVAMTSEDVIHGFWIPRLAGKLDAIPGRVNLLRITAEAPGSYGGLCAEYCGIEHAGMSFEVVAHAPADFAALLAGDGAAGAAGAGDAGGDGGPGNDGTAGSGVADDAPDAEAPGDGIGADDGGEDNEGAGGDGVIGGNAGEEIGQ